MHSSTTLSTPTSSLWSRREADPKRNESYMPTGKYSSALITFNPVNRFAFPSREVYSFPLVFSSGFVEASTDVNMTNPQPDHDEGDTASDSTCLFRQFEDSDDEEDDLMSDLPDEPSFDGTIEPDVLETSVSSTTPPVVEDSTVKHSEGTANADNSVVPSIITEGDESRNVRPKLSHPSSPRSMGVSLVMGPDCLNHISSPPETPAVPGPKKMQVIVGDVAYATYKAVLYYVRRHFHKFLTFTHQSSQIYTDVIVFAPLSSSFTAAASSRRLTATRASVTPSDSQSSLHDGPKAPAHIDNPTSRREWIKKWQQCRPGRPAPCSAKAIFRLADSE